VPNQYRSAGVPPEPPTQVWDPESAPQCPRRPTVADSRRASSRCCLGTFHRSCQSHSVQWSQLAQICAKDTPGRRVTG
jgi:hypothetical protein